MTNIIESAIEKFAIELLEKQGYLEICAFNRLCDTLLPKLMSGEIRFAKEKIIEAG
jgi:hypothetical protein